MPDHIENGKTVHWCTVCRTYKPLDNFHRGQYRCKQCAQMMAKVHKELHPEVAKKSYRRDKVYKEFRELRRATNKRIKLTIERLKNEKSQIYAHSA